MKMNILKIGFFSLIFLLTLLTTSCGEHNHNHDEEDTEMSEGETIEKTGLEYQSAFVCPMHCEGSGSDEEGQCPVCKMAYVANENHIKDSHEH